MWDEGQSLAKVFLQNLLLCQEFMVSSEEFARKVFRRIGFKRFFKEVGQSEVAAAVTMIFVRKKEFF